MKKKILVYGLMTVLSLSILSGCGSKKNSEKGGHKVDKSIKEVAENVADSIADIDSMKLGLKGNIDLTAESEGLKYSVKGNAELNGAFTVDVPEFNVDGKVLYELNQSANKLSGEYSVNSYGETDGDTMNIYTKTNITDWTHESIDVSEYLEEVSSFKEEMEEIAEQIKDLSDKEIEDEFGKYFKLEDTTKAVNGKECYVISADLDLDDINELNEYGMDDFDDTEIDQLDFSYGVCIDKDTYMPVKIYCNISAHVNDEYVEYTINNMSFEFNFVANSGKVKSAPKDAKQAADENDGPSDLFGSITSKAKDARDNMEDEDDNKGDTKESNKTNNDEKDYGTVDKKYIPKSFKLNGKEIKFGDKVSEILDAGYEIESDEGKKIKANDSQLYLFTKKDSDISFTVDIYNSAENDINVKDGVISGIFVSDVDGINFELDNGITLNSTISDVEEVYKNQKCSDKYNGATFGSVSYEDDDYNEVSFDYDLGSGKITDIDVYFFQK